MLLAVNVDTPVAPSDGAEAAEMGPAGAEIPDVLLVVIRPVEVIPPTVGMADMPAGNTAAPPPG